MIDETTYYNNLFVIQNYHKGDNIISNNEKMEVTSSSDSTKDKINEFKTSFFNTIKWMYNEINTESNDDHSYQMRFHEELCPGGKLENILVGIREVGDTFFGTENEINVLKPIKEEIQKFQNDILQKYDKQLFDAFYENFLQSYENKELTDVDPNHLQKVVSDELKWLEWKFTRGPGVGFDLKDDHYLLDYGNFYDSCLYLLEGMNQEEWMTDEIRQKISSLREIQQKKIEEKIQWVEKTCPELKKSVINLMVARRMATHPNPYNDDKINTLKELFSPNNPKGQFASVGFNIPTVNVSGEKTDFFKESKVLISKDEMPITNTEFYVKPNLGEPECYLSMLKLNHDKISDELGADKQILPSKIEMVGFKPGGGAIRERVAYKLQESLKVDFGVQPTVILDANYNQFNLDGLYQTLINYEILDENLNPPCTNSFSCFIKFVQDVKSYKEEDAPKQFEKEFHKPLINTLLINADGHLDNCLVKDDKLVLIDFGYAIPDINKKNLIEIRQCKNLLMDHPYASKPMDDTVRQKFLAINVKEVMKAVREDISLHKEEFGENCSLTEESLNMIEANLLLIKVGAKLNRSPREIDATQWPIRIKTQNKGEFEYNGGEYAKIYAELIQGKKNEDIEWKEVESQFAEVLSKSLSERKTQDKAFTNLRLRK